MTDQPAPLDLATLLEAAASTTWTAWINARRHAGNAHAHYRQITDTINKTDTTPTTEQRNTTKPPP
jgi:hypothetical protein